MLCATLKGNHSVLRQREALTVSSVPNMVKDAHWSYHPGAPKKKKNRHLRGGMQVWKKAVPLDKDSSTKEAKNPATTMMKTKTNT
jgi:hypothetical protein